MSHYLPCTRHLGIAVWRSRQSAPPFMILSRVGTRVYSCLPLRWLHTLRSCFYSYSIIITHTLDMTHADKSSSVDILNF